MAIHSIIFAVSGCVGLVLCHFLLYRKSRLFRLFSENPARPVSNRADWFTTGRLHIGFLDWFHFFLIAIDDEHLHLLFYAPQRFYLRPGRASVPLGHLKLQPVIAQAGERAHVLDQASNLDFMVFGAPGKALQARLSPP
ncbi:MAG: hypothetical protein HY823_14025 [Acidobacteria bacterium]|nr:hypothetical protein [Acidobacteriota bacterium]